MSNYAKKEFGLEWSHEDASRTIISFLGQFGVEFLRAYIFNTALPEVPKLGSHNQYVVSRFIRDIYDRADPIFDCVSVLVKGHMYANALVCPDLESLEKKFDNVIFYVDTPLILNTLKLQGKEEYAVTQELFDLVRRLHGKIAIFEHTLDEVRNVLSAAERNLDNPATESPVVREIRSSSKKRSDLILLREKLRETLENQAINIVKTPRYKTDYQISEEELESAINERVTYRNPYALQFDINSIRSIYALREGKIPRRLEDAVAVFVTPNTAIARAAFKIGKQHNSTREVSSVITDYSLANVAWLKAPLGAPELPEKELLAACYAAMEPGVPLWSKYLTEIDKLEKASQISVDDHALLRISPLVPNELMNLTLV